MLEAGRCSLGLLLLLLLLCPLMLFTFMLACLLFGKYACSMSLDERSTAGMNVLFTKVEEVFCNADGGLLCGPLTKDDALE